jgi:hypothetical protein
VALRVGMTPEAVAAVSAPGVHTAHILSIKYPNGTVRFTDYARDIEHDGFVYQALNVPVSISAVTETNDLEISTLVLELSAIKPGIVAAVLLYDHINREVVLSRVILDRDGNNITVVVLFDGLSSNAGILDPDTGAPPVVQIEASSHFGDLDQRRGRYTNNEAQQDLFPGDKGFEFVTDLVDPILWGRKERL